MTRPLHPVIRDLHLYIGLFLSPFILVFATSVIFLVHSWVPGSQTPASSRSAADLALPPEFEQLKGREQVAAARRILEQIDVQGEIWRPEKRTSRRSSLMW